MQLLLILFCNRKKKHAFLQHLIAWNLNCITSFLYKVFWWVTLLNNFCCLPGASESDYGGHCLLQKRLSFTGRDLSNPVPGPAQKAAAKCLYVISNGFISHYFTYTLPKSLTRVISTLFLMWHKAVIYMWVVDTLVLFLWALKLTLQ